MGFPPVHTPLWQVSDRVQALPSVHALPSGLAGFEHAPVAGLQVPASWHWSSAEQPREGPPAHTPLWPVSVRVHAVPSLHALPSGLAGFEQAPVAGSQVPASWHSSGAGHDVARLPTQAPFWHVSAWVQVFPSLQALPSGLVGFEHVPVVGLQVPASWHWSGAGQTIAFVPVHVPFWQVSACVHALPSLHALPSGLAGFEHVPVAGLQVPASWHWSWAMHT